jgi:hypothetical protein
LSGCNPFSKRAGFTRVDVVNKQGSGNAAKPYSRTRVGAANTRGISRDATK